MKNRNTNSTKRKDNASALVRALNFSGCADARIASTVGIGSLSTISLWKYGKTSIRAANYSRLLDLAQTFGIMTPDDALKICKKYS